MKKQVTETVFDPAQLHFMGYRMVRAEIDSSWDFEPDETRNFSYNYHFEVAFSLETNDVRTSVQLSIENPSVSEGIPPAKGFYEFGFLFEVENLKELVEVKRKKVTGIEPNLLLALASLSYSTTRGILMARLEGTALAGFILPIIDPVLLTNTAPLRG